MSGLTLMAKESNPLLPKDKDGKFIRPKPPITSPPIDQVLQHDELS